MNDIVAYNGNPNLKQAGVQIDWTEEQLDEFIKCKQDPIYFIQNYVKIITLDHGVQKMDLFGYQEDIVNSLHQNNKTAAVICRQAGKCVTKNTKYKIRNKKTGQVLEVSAEEFHRMNKT